MVHCLFEQSGTFKKQFLRLGIHAEDYDVLNEFGQTDHIIDLFEEIRKGYNEQKSVFDDIKKEDLIMAFFPCTRFEAIIPLAFRGEQMQQKNWDDIKKLENSMKLHEELHELYELLCMMVIVVKRKGLQMIIENPYTQPHYLTTYWCLRPDYIDLDRRENGDYYKKPTQYWFINRGVKCNLDFEPIEYVKSKVIDRVKLNDISVKTQRSMIHPQYAKRFITQFILNEDGTL